MTEWTPDEVITCDNLANRLCRVKGSTTVSVTIETMPSGRMRRTDNPFWSREDQVWWIARRKRMTCYVGPRYARMINTRRAAERNLDNSNRGRAATLEPGAMFVAQPRTWGERLYDTPLVSYRGQLYVDVPQIKDYEEKHFDLTTGEDIPPEVIAEWLPPPRNRKALQAKQGISNVVEWKDFTLTRIRWIRMFGSLFRVELPRRKHQ